MMQNKIKAAIARRSRDEALHAMIENMYEQIATCETALAALPRMCPEIDENHDAKISLEVARKALRDLQQIVGEQVQTALLAPPDEQDETG